jgi:hypothetical protein
MIGRASAGAALAATIATIISTTVASIIKRLMRRLLPPATRRPEHIRVLGEKQFRVQGNPRFQYKEASGCFPHPLATREGDQAALRQSCKGRLVGGGNAIIGTPGAPARSLYCLP